jgi:exodeoxyribonuclease-3
MRVATWNVNGLRSRLDFVLHWLRARRPDVVGFQELKLTDDQFPHEALEAEGYRAVVHGQKAWNGVAILSREPAVTVQAGLPGGESFGARLITARVGDLTYATVYCPNGKSVAHEDFPRKLEWFGALRTYLAQSLETTERFVIGGDFNICPSAIDSWNEAGLAGRIFHTDEERRRFRDLLDCGLVDLFRSQHPDTQAFSWWDYRGGAFHKKQGLRIDFLLGTRTVADSLHAAEIDRDYRKKKDGLTPSDHAPVMVDLAD